VRILKPSSADRLSDMPAAGRAAALVRIALEPRKPGRLKGRIRMGEDFDAPLPEEILAAFRDYGIAILST
jgi:hypothetical protein